MMLFDLLYYLLLYLNFWSIKSFVYFRLFQIRGKLYELLINCIPPEIILKVKTWCSFLNLIFSFPVLNFIFVFTSEAALWIVKEIGWRIKAWGLPLGCILCKFFFFLWVFGCQILITHVLLVLQVMYSSGRDIEFSARGLIRLNIWW